MKLFELFLIEFNVINDKESYPAHGIVTNIAEYVAQYSDQIEYDQAKSWFKKQVRKFLLSDPETNSQIHKVPENSPDWAKKAAEHNELYAFAPNNKRDREFQHLTDWLNGLLITSKEELDKDDPTYTVQKQEKTEALKILKGISRMTTPDAIKASEEYYKRGTKKALKQEDSEGTKSIIEFKDGYRWVEITDAEGFKREGKVMQNCIGTNYSVERCGIEKRRIFILRDQSNQSHIALESLKKYGDTSIIQIKGKGNIPPNQEYMKYVLSFIKKSKMDVSSEGQSDLSRTGYIYHEGEIQNIRDAYEPKFVKELGGNYSLYQLTTPSALWSNYHDIYGGRKDLSNLYEILSTGKQSIITILVKNKIVKQLILHGGNKEKTLKKYNSLLTSVFKDMKWSLDEEEFADYTEYGMAAIKTGFVPLDEEYPFKPVLKTTTGYSWMARPVDNPSLRNYYSRLISMIRFEDTDIISYIFRNPKNEIIITLILQLNKVFGFKTELSLGVSDHEEDSGISEASTIVVGALNMLMKKLRVDFVKFDDLSEHGLVIKDKKVVDVRSLYKPEKIVELPDSYWTRVFTDVDEHNNALTEVYFGDRENAGTVYILFSKNGEEIAKLAVNQRKIIRGWVSEEEEYGSYLALAEIIDELNPLFEKEKIEGFTQNYYINTFIQKGYIVKDHQIIDIETSYPYKPVYEFDDGKSLVLSTMPAAEANIYYLNIINIEKKLMAMTYAVMDETGDILGGFCISKQGKISKIFKKNLSGESDERFIEGMNNDLLPYFNTFKTDTGLVIGGTTGSIIIRYETTPHKVLSYIGDHPGDNRSGMWVTGLGRRVTGMPGRGDSGAPDNQLEKMGLITIERPEHSYSLTITPKGKEALKFMDSGENYNPIDLADKVNVIKKYPENLPKKKVKKTKKKT